MKKTETHPARSLGFLSRLCDGDLSPAEKRAFEAHRAECPDCNEAAAEFEAVLAMYRKAEVPPPDPSLAVRIARQAQADLRKPRSGSFLFVRLDIVWATIAIVALVGALVVYRVRRQARLEPAERSIVVALGQPRTQLRPATPAHPSQPPAVSNRPASSKKAPAALKGAGLWKPREPVRREAAASPGAATQATAAAPSPASDAGRHAVENKTAPQAFAAAAAPHFAVTPRDGLGAAPSTIGPIPELSEAARGEEFDLTVDAAGRVLEVAPAGTEKPASRAEGAVSRMQDETLRRLRLLRFSPGERARRLRVRIE
jgi:Putative zinc-finger